MSPRLRLFLPLVAFAILAAVLFRGLSLDPSELPSALIDRPMPEFRLPTLSSVEEGGPGTFTHDDLVGRPLLLNVWATWCISCRVEHPYLQELARTGVPIYGLNYKDDSVDARAWLGDLGDPYIVNIVDAEGALGLDLGVYGAPETFFLDARGVIRYRHVGVIDETLWRTRLQPIYEELLREAEA